MSIYKGVEIGPINLDNLRKVEVETEIGTEIWIVNMVGVLIERIIKFRKNAKQKNFNRESI